MSGDTLFQHVILSPHLDDAPLSCGGAIHHWAQAGEPVLVVTCMAGDPPAGPLSDFAEFQHRNWELDAQEAYAARRAEERKALRILGATYRHLNFLDCIYRGDGKQFFYHSDADIFGAVHPADRGLVEDLMVAFRDLSGLTPATRVYAPLGIGNHVDHQLLRSAAQAWRGNRVLFYEDYPYAERGVSAVGYSPVLTPLQEADLAAKVAAIDCYRSQISTLFGDRTSMENRVWRYAERISGRRGYAERFWRPALAGEQDAG